jgi:nucleolar GTP-binding protein
MNKITDSKPEIAPYPFTTKGLNVGHFMKKYMPIPVIDTPGLLDRPLHERNKIELKAITAFQHLKGTILFVVDPLDDLEKQKNLFAEMRKLFTNQGVIIVINKTDIAPPEWIEKAKEAFKDYSIIIEGNGLNNLKEELLK